jgi:hypothetical protein
MAFSATDAAFEGFRLVRRNPMALVVWSALYLILSLASLYASAESLSGMVAMNEMIEGMEASPPASFQDMIPVFDAYGQAMSHTLWLMPISLLVGSVIYAAVARGVLTPEDKAFGYVRFGMDEVRVLVVSIVVTLAAILIYCLAIAVVIAIGAVAIATEQAWMGLIVVVAIFAAIALMIWLAVRWSLAIPIVVAEKRFAFFDSFALTKGRFWPLLGMAIIAGLLSIVIWFLSMIVVMPVSMMSGMGMMSAMGASTDPSAMLEAFDPTNPWMIATAVLNAIIYGLMVGVVYAPFGAAYRDIVASTRGAAASD